MGIAGRELRNWFVTVPERYSWRLLPIVIGLLGISITAFSWHALRVEEDRAIERTTAAEAKAVRLAVESRLGNRLSAIDRMGARWESRGRIPKDQWEFEAGLNIRDFHGLQAIEWVDPTYYVRWVVPMEGNESIVDLNLSTEARRRAALEDARLRRTMTVTQPVELIQGGMGFLAYRPLFRGSEFDGFFVGVFRIDELFAAVLDESVAPGYAVRVSDNGEVLYTRSTGSPNEAAARALDDVVELSGHTWDIRVWPEQGTVAVQATSLPEVVLGAGSLVSVFLALSVFFGQATQRRARDAEVLNDALEREVIERTLAEKLQRHQATLLEAQGEAALDAVMVVGDDRRIVYFNRRLAELWGIPEEVLATRSIAAVLDAVRDLWPDPEAFIANFEYLSDHPDDEMRAETFLNDGRVLDQYSGPVRQSDGACYGRIWCFRDITERVQAERDLKRFATQLERSNRELEQFAYIVAHDLKAPLVSLQGMIGILVEDYGDQFDSDAALYMDRITANARKMQLLLSELLELSRVGRGDMERESVDLQCVVLQVLEQLDQSLTKRQANVSGVDALPVVSADRVRMLQLFTNLIDNAVKYTPPERQPRIDIRAEDREDDWAISVSDNGIGIPKAFHEKIFSVFQRLPEGKALNPDGTGIGLATVARIVEMHGGILWIASDEGSGATFHFSLPKGDSVTASGDRHPVERSELVAAH